MTRRKTSVYLDDELAERLATLAHEEGRSQAAILRDAIAGYQPRSAPDRRFALAAGFQRTDHDSRPIFEIPESELFDDFGT